MITRHRPFNGPAMWTRQPSVRLAPAVDRAANRVVDEGGQIGIEENKAALAESIAAFNDAERRHGYLEIHDRSVAAFGLRPTDEPLDFDGVKQFYEGVWAAFPDCTATIEDVIGEGDTLAFRATFRGTHRGEFLGVPPTGTQITMAVHNFYRFRDGKVVERWSNPDLLGLLVQLGAIPAPG